MKLTALMTFLAVVGAVTLAAAARDGPPGKTCRTCVSIGADLSESDWNLRSQNITRGFCRTAQAYMSSLFNGMLAEKGVLKKNFTVKADKCDSISATTCGSFLADPNETTRQTFNAMLVNRTVTAIQANLAPKLCGDINTVLYYTTIKSEPTRACPKYYDYFECRDL